MINIKIPNSSLTSHNIYARIINGSEVVKTQLTSASSSTALTSITHSNSSKSNVSKTETKSYSSTGSHTTSYSYSSAPKKAFTYKNVTFFGSGKDKLSTSELKSTDLVINCTGIEIRNTPFIISLPKIIKIPIRNTSSFHQIVFDWKDYGTPPKNFGLEQWTSLFNQLLEHNIKNVYVCCQGGQGRTGTALACLLLASQIHAGEEKSINGNELIETIRRNYSSQAIENNSQEYYVLYAASQGDAALYEEWKKLVKVKGSSYQYEHYK